MNILLIFFLCVSCTTCLDDSVASAYRKQVVLRRLLFSLTSRTDFKSALAKVASIGNVRAWLYLSVVYVNCVHHDSLFTMNNHIKRDLMSNLDCLVLPSLASLEFNCHISDPKSVATPLDDRQGCTYRRAI